jgi:hypothetical protein
MANSGVLWVRNNHPPLPAVLKGLVIREVPVGLAVPADLAAFERLVVLAAQEALAAPG